MKLRSALALLIAITASLAVCQQPTSQGKTASDTTSLQQMFIKMENEWAKADNSKDTKVLDRILADDWTYLGATGIQTKAQHLADLKSGGGGLEFETLADIKVRVFGDTAVVNGSAEQKSSNKASDTSGHYVWTDVFVKRHGRWQAVNSQDTLTSHK
jgi:ketosteroid isomerase-like protein